MNIVLIGFRGTGKTAAGRLVAQELGWEFIDADDYLEKKIGKSIKDIFKEGGEGRFRDLEEEVIAELSLLENKIIAAGGGAVLREENVKSMKKNAVVILLEADADTIYQRLHSDPKSKTQRPRLTPMDDYNEILHLLEYRRPYYEKASDHRIETAKLSPKEVAQEILSLFREITQGGV